MCEFLIENLKTWDPAQRPIQFAVRDRVIDRVGAADSRPIRAVITMYLLSGCGIAIPAPTVGAAKKHALAR